MIDRNHPAVMAALNAETQRQRTRVDAYADDHIVEMCAALTAAMSHMESATEENITRLRHTPAGRALMAEGWDEAIYDTGIWKQIFEAPDNPYREVAPNE